MATNVKSYKDTSADPALRCAEVLQKVADKTRGSAQGARGRPSVAVSACGHRPGPGDRVQSADRSASVEVRSEGGPAVGGPVLPVRPLPDDRLLAGGRPAGQPAGALERQRQPAVGQQVHLQYQHGDELLGDRADQPQRVRPAAVRRPGRASARRAVPSPRSTTTPPAGSCTTTSIYGAARPPSTPPTTASGRPAGLGCASICGGITSTRATRPSWPSGRIP